MLGLSVASLACAGAALFASTVAADVDPIVIKGSKFFYKTNGTQFFIKGVAYQNSNAANGSEPSTDATINDPLTDINGCKRDIPYLQKLQTNVIRVYSIDTSKSHDDCMTAMANAGIYVLADLSAPNASISRTDPAWDEELYARYTSVVDLMSKYTNTMGFFAGNEVANNASNTNAMAFVKAAVRDTKAYIKQKNYRPMGVGYAADDDATIRANVRLYIDCGQASDAVDFFGYNIYSWCGQNTPDKYQTSGYADRTKEYANYTVPVFFAEYGCNQPAPRLFDDTIALYGSNMSKVWSGGIVYEYFQEENDYGLVEVNGNSVSTRADFANLATQIAKVSPSGINSASYNPTNTQMQPCPATANPSSWAASSKLPPTPNEQLCSCMVAGLSCVAKQSVSDDSFQKLFDAACTANVACSGILANATTGKYGAFSMCSPAEKLSWAFNNYYQQTNQASTSCDFNGAAQKQSGSAPSQCSGLLQQAGAAGTGTVTSQPTSTGGINSGSGSGSGSGGSGSSSSSSAASNAVVPPFDFALLKMGVWVAVATAAGAMLML